jgi:hypothetical protein
MGNSVQKELEAIEDKRKDIDHKKAKLKSRQEKYLIRLRVLAKELGRVPYQNEFISRGLGQWVTIKSNFGNWEAFVKKAKLPKDEVLEYSIDEEMEDLRKIMLDFRLDPCLNQGEEGYKQVSRLIFCNVLAEKYPHLQEKVKEKKKHKQGKEQDRERVLKFIKCKSRATFYYNIRKDGIKSLEGYKNYDNMYKVIRAGFKKDKRYEDLKGYEQARDHSQEKMNELMKDLIGDDLIDKKD